MNLEAGEVQLQQQLLATSEEYRRLAAAHRAHAEELERLSRRPHLTESERFQEVTLKKKKLLLKDQMYSMLQRYRKEMEVGS